MNPIEWLNDQFNELAVNMHHYKMVRSKDPIKQRQHMEMMRFHITKRHPERVERMEREQGIY